MDRRRRHGPARGRGGGCHRGTARCPSRGTADDVVVARPHAARLHRGHVERLHPARAGRGPARRGGRVTRIKHVFVLMLENRSFDHLLAFSGIPGLPPPQAILQKGAPDRLGRDPLHEFNDVRDQIANGTMSGFSGDELRAFDASAVPTIVALARNSLLFDTWFSSMPGPTWPNRLF